MPAGETIAIEFSSADATTAAAVTLKDANNATRTLAANERLLIDNLTCASAAAVLKTDVFDDKNADGNVNAGETLASFTPGSGYFQSNDEGTSVTLANTPKVKSTVAGNIVLTGSGRIIIGKTQGLRPTWRESLVPGA